MRLLLMGSNGIVGQAIIEKVNEKYKDIIKVIPVTRKDCNILEQTEIVNLLHFTIYDVMINCIALTDLDLCETEPDLAYETNVNAVQQLSFYNSFDNRAMIHLSSATVYGDTDGKVNKVGDSCFPKSQYAVTKLAGEKRVLQHDNSYVVRTSWVYSSDRNQNKFVPKIVDKFISTQDKKIPITTQMGSPTFVEDLADFLIMTAIALHKKDRKIVDKIKSNGKIIQFSDKGFASRYDMAVFIYNYLRNNNIIQRDIDIIRQDEYNYKRNVHEMLDSISYNKWEDNLKKCLDKMFNMKSQVSEDIFFPEYWLQEENMNQKVTFSTMFDSEGAY